MALSFRFWRAASAAGLACALVLPSAAAARPLSVEDVLHREAFGTVELTRDGRWAVVEERGPYASASRFDYLLANALFRTRLMVADLRGGGRLRPLFRAEPGTGYELGRMSPDGRHVAVFRLRPGHWELGVADLRTRTVRWLGVTPEYEYGERGVAWRSADELIAIDRQDEPLELRWMRPAEPLPARHARVAHGGLSVTVVGSGRYIGVRPQGRPKRLVEISIRSGRVRTLARGAFTDFEVSRDGRRVAALEAGADIPLSPDHAIQGPYGVATRRMRLVLLDLVSGGVRRLPTAMDVLGGLLSWSPDSRELLAYARPDGAPWTAGRLLRVDGASGSVSPAGPQIRPLVDRRPEVVYAGWLGADPIVFGRPAAGGRDDWYRLAAAGPVNLTASLKAPPRTGVVLAGGALWLAADDAAWKIAPDGEARRLADHFAPVPRSHDGFQGRATLAPTVGGVLLGAGRGATGPQLVAFGPNGASVLPTPGGAKPVAAADAVDAGALAVRSDGGGRDALLWINRSGRRTLATLNQRYADVELPQAVPVRHTGPNGESLTSWILLPNHPIEPGRPPPLIAAPYLGYVYPRSPVAAMARQGPLEAELLLAAHGYAVLVPSLPVRHPSTGPADRLAAQLLEIVDRAAAQPDLKGRFDPQRLGIFGHSFGGYSVLATIAETDRFRAAVANAPIADLISIHGEFDEGRAVYPDEGLSTPFTAGWAEDLQGDMRAPPYADPARYVLNSPVLQAQHIRTPLLLMKGELDNMPLSQAQEMFSELYRQDKDAELVTYWGAPHIYQSPGDLRDFYRRTFAWFDGLLLTPSAAGAPPEPAAGAGAAAQTTRPPSR